MSETGGVRTGLRIAAGIAIVFGALTILSGGRALFGGPEATAAVGAAVPFVLWFNTLAGFAYVAAGLGLLARRRWAFPLSVAIAAATIVVFAAFGLHVLQGGAFEMRTVWAMTLRAAVWLVIAVLVYRAIARD
jgi:hypothetical protein